MSKRVIKFESLENALVATNQAGQFATGEGNFARQQGEFAQEAATDALSSAGVDPNFISYDVGVLPDSSGAVEGTIGAYFTDSGLWQKLEWDGSEWQDIGEPIVTRKNLPFVNVRDFGAVGNDSDSDSLLNYNAIKSAIAYLNSLGGGVLFFPKGIYQVHYPLGEASITISSNTTINGEGSGLSVIKAADSAPVPGDPNTGEADKPFLIEGQNVHNVAITNITLDGNRQRDESVTGHGWFEIVEIDANGFFANNVEIINSFAEGFDIDSGSNYFIDNVRAFNCGGNPFHFSGTDTKNVFLSNCQAISCGDLRANVGSAEERTAAFLIDASNANLVNCISIDNYRGLLIGGGGGNQDTAIFTSFVDKNPTSDQSVVIRGVPADIQLISPTCDGDIEIRNGSKIQIIGGSSARVVRLGGYTEASVFAHRTILSNISNDDPDRYQPFTVSAPIKDISSPLMGILGGEVKEYTPPKQRSLLILSGPNAAASGLCHFRVGSSNFVATINIGDNVHFATIVGAATSSSGEDNKFNVLFSDNGKIYFVNRRATTSTSVTII
jgi:hypothetical protein